MATKVSPLQALLGATTDATKQVSIKRLGTSFTVKALTGAEFDRIRMQLTYADGKGGKQVNDDNFDAAIIAAGCVEPAFSDRSLIAHYGAEDAADCVKKALMAGEIKRIANAILDISGFTEEDVDFPN